MDDRAYGGAERPPDEPAHHDEALPERAVHERAVDERAVAERAVPERPVPERAPSGRAVPERAPSDRDLPEAASPEHAPAYRIPADADIDLLGLDLESLRTVEHPVLSALVSDLRARAAGPGGEALWGFESDPSAPEATG
ncbi:FxSxx-COOH cyclophane-containing RiPP peptide [Streptomyces sp. NPDC008079]|uniref:FxSxx-COOH cyclophane-containing RiPP peptide n=1 Tax=Streptomyces sp. NPDC008079 TaxID=3364806 RepID=UPI0036E9F617